jgi:Uma2 family endonuclease
MDGSRHRPDVDAVRTSRLTRFAVPAISSHVGARFSRKSASHDRRNDDGRMPCEAVRSCRAPDVAFVRRERVPSPQPRGFFQGPPDIAIEVLWPDDRMPDVRARIEEYFLRTRFSISAT